jgi:cell division septal protein FtsQ
MRYTESRTVWAGDRRHNSWLGRVLGFGRGKRTHTMHYEVAVPAARRNLSRQLFPARLFSLLLMAVAAWLLYSFNNSDIFYVNDLTIEGNNRLTAEDLLATSDLLGMNVFWINTYEAVEAIEALPYVESARMHCGIPARCVIQLEERSPLFVWRQGDAQVWISSDGTVLPVRGELSDSIVLDAGAGRALKPGDHLDQNVVLAVEELSRLKPEVKAYQYSDQFGLAFVNDHGWPVRLGDGADIGVKLKVLNAVTDYLVNDGITPAFIDVQYPDAPFYGE